MLYFGCSSTGEQEVKELRAQLHSVTVKQELHDWHMSTPAREQEEQLSAHTPPDDAANLQAPEATKPDANAAAEVFDRKTLVLPDSRLPPAAANFVGRVGLLGAMHSALGACDRLVVLALLGPEGSGKSALVSEYLHLYSESYTFVWWFRADTVLRMEEGLRRCVPQSTQLCLAFA